MKGRARLTISGSRFSEAHGFEKPNDERALKLMDHAACAVMSEYPDITLAFGESDEYRCGRASTERNSRDLIY